ncbi:MAG: Dabb family protein [Candidatus Pristimantibacillus sp.]
MSQVSIIHSVIFTLKHDKGSAEELRFLQDGKAILSAIPSVKDFQVFRQISAKNNYDFGFSMVFDHEADYEAYNVHALHVEFVEQRWEKEVERFLEIDYSEL